MNPSTSPVSADLAVLYELSLSIGNSLDLQSTSQDFLRLLVARCALEGAELWWQDADASDRHSGELILLDSAPPRPPNSSLRLPATHALWKIIHDGKNGTFAGDGQHDSCCFFPLSKHGVLLLYPSPQAPLTVHFLDHLSDVLAKLACALQSATDYAQLKKAESVLRAAAPQQNASHVHWHALINNLPDLVWLKDGKGVYLACNKRFECFFGATEKDIAGKTDYDFVDEDIADAFREQDQIAIAKGGNTVNEEWVTFADDGHRELLETTKTPMYDTNGKLIGVLGVGHDITARKQIEETLRLTDERSRTLAAMLRLMCDNVPDMIWAKGLDKRYMFANKALCEDLLCARDVKEPLGKTDLFFARREREKHPEDAHWHTFGEICQDSDDITLERGKPSVFEESGNVQGRFKCLEVHKSPFFNARGEIIGTVGSAREITDRKRIENELELHRQHLAELVEQRSAELQITEAKASHILQSSADGLYGVDADGLICFINPAACKMLGYSMSAVLGRCPHALFHHSRPDGSAYPIEECPANQALRSCREMRVDSEVYWHADGHAIPVMYAVHPILQNGISTGAVISFVDISLQRAAAEAREQALNAAEHLAQVKSEFLANMSHEIRTPLNGVLGFAQIGYRNFQDCTQAFNAFEKILSSGNRLLAVVNDILDFSKIEAGKMSIEQTEASLDEIIESALNLVRDRALAKRLELRVEKTPDLPPSCLSDPLRIGQILLNLLSNAVKFTESGSVTLSASHSGNELIFRVTDTGIGIDCTRIDSLFNPFQQLDGSSTRRFDGTGLGLAISKRILELMDGSIHVESQPGTGSTFEVRLPYIKPDSHCAPEDCSSLKDSAGQSAPPLSGLNILVAEDDAVSQLVLEHNLLEDGAKVVIVNNGHEAILRIMADGADFYDLVLMDIQMPEMDGYQATRRIREFAPKLPVIGQTAHALEEEKAKCFAAGMIDHISKPIDPLTLSSTLLRIIGSKKHN